jgi:PAS domain S-box-containing protein
MEGSSEEATSRERADLTKLRHAESDLLASEARYRMFVDFAADAFMVHTEDATVIDVNRQACESLGYAREELIGMKPAQFDAGLDATGLQRVVARVEAGEVLTFETRWRRKDGTVFPVEVRGRQFWQGDRWFGISISRDITERNRAEAELRTARAALAQRQRVSMLGELAAALAHEIKQPISGAMIDATACLRALAPDRLDVDEARRAASRLVKEATWADEIINRTSAMYRQGASRRDRVDVDAVVGEMVALLRHETTPYSIAMRTDLTEGLPDAIVDRVQLQQVLMNLMLNAIDAMRDTGGELTIVSRNQQDGSILVSVRDTGVGLPTERADQIFDAFVTTKLHGTGMGLAISRSIVTGHGGLLWATSNEGPGATFHFTLPTRVIESE